MTTEVSKSTQCDESLKRRGASLIDEHRFSAGTFFVLDAMIWFCAMLVVRSITSINFLLEIDWQIHLSLAFAAAILQNFLATLVDLFRSFGTCFFSRCGDLSCLFVVVAGVGLILAPVTLPLGALWTDAYKLIILSTPVAVLFSVGLRLSVISLSAGGGTATSEKFAIGGTVNPQFEPRRWESRYARKIHLTDIAVVLLAVFTAQFLRFESSTDEFPVLLYEDQKHLISYTLLSLGIAFFWLVGLEYSRTRDVKALGIGIVEYKRLFNSSVLTFGVLAIVSYITRAQLARSYMLIALPLGIMLLIATRWLWRKRLQKQRVKNLNTYRTLVAAEPERSTHLTKEIMRNKHSGFDLVGVVTQEGVEAEIGPGVSVVGCYSDIPELIKSKDIDTVIVASNGSLSPEDLRHLSWDLQKLDVDLIVTATLTGVDGSRIHMRPAEGLPLLHVEHPHFDGRKVTAKRSIDLVFSAALLIVLAPLFVVISALVKFTSQGPVFFKQRRIGWNGREFYMIKFRSMVVDAEERLSELQADSDGNGVLFKMNDDPRITKVGRFLRRYSLDELPQIINVLKGEMSLVGPRPPLESEVAVYEEDVLRRLLVRPGITGLWQVSGRSDLSWEDSVRLDLYYVENWSLFNDMVILLKTVSAVLRPSGAY